MHLPPLDAALRAEARTLFEGTSLPLRAIAAQLGIHRNTVANMARIGAWQRPFRASRRKPRPPAARRAVLERLWAVAEHDLGSIEAACAAGPQDEAAREAGRKAMTGLARVLRELVALEQTLGPAPEEEPPRDLDALRDKLAARIEQYRAERAAADGDGRAGEAPPAPM